MPVYEGIIVSMISRMLRRVAAIITIIPDVHYYHKLIVQGFMERLILKELSNLSNAMMQSWHVLQLTASP